MTGLSLSVLGPLRLAVDGTDVTPRSPMVRRLLALMACRANESVRVDDLVTALWPDPPASARENVRQYVSYLRKVVDDRLVRDPGGYRLAVDDTELDLLRFESLTAKAEAAGDPGDVEALLSEALELWRGPAFEDVAGAESVAPVASRLAEARLLATEQRTDARLSLGRYGDVLTELAELVDAHPLRERFRGQLMRALHGRGRTAEALEVFEEGSRLLAERLGLDPGAALQQLASEISLEAAPRPVSAPGPAELPADVAAFTGRSDAVVRLRAALESGAVGVVSAIAGTGGIGKSALAIHVGHQVADRFPDGQLYVNLHGATPNVKPLEPAQALRQMLRSLGAEDGSIPQDVDEAAARFRSATAGRRLLIVLDNARNTAQVRPLLPASPLCGVVLTGRRAMNLDGVHHERLDVLSEEEAAGLLTRLIEPERRDEAAARDVAAECGRLPLAICIAAARLNARPVWDLRMLADRLSRENRRLGELEAGDRGVRASFMVSYHELDEEPQRLFRMIGLLDTADTGLPVAAALADVDDGRAEDLLDTLADVQLIEAQAPGRYRMHDLLRLFARERAEEEDTGEDRARAVRRGLQSYLTTARTAARVINPTSTWRADIGPRVPDSRSAAPASREDAYAWLDEELVNLRGVVGQAQRAGDPALVIGLTAALDVVLTFRGRSPEKLVLGEMAIEAATRTGDFLHLALAHEMFGEAHSEVGQVPIALAHKEQARDAYAKAGHRQGEANMSMAMANALSSLGRFEEALRNCRRGIDIYREIGRRPGLSTALTILGILYQRLEQPEAAVQANTDALTVAMEIGDPTSEIHARCNLAESLRRAARPRDAIDQYVRTQEMCRATGDADSYVSGEIWWGLGWCHHELGHLERARHSWRQAAAVLHYLGLISNGEKRDIESSDAPETPEIIRRNQ